ncbi:MAG: M1 family aminopeptidase [bacterium]
MKPFFTLLLLAFAINIYSQNDKNRLDIQQKSFNNQFNKTFDTKYPSDDKYDVTYYMLNLSIEHSFYTSNYISGSVQMKAKSTVANLTTCYMDLVNAFQIDSVKSTLGAIVYNHTGDKINLTFPSALQIDEPFDVTIYYKGIPGSSGWGSFSFTTHNSNPVIWSLSEPYGSSDWWPCKDTPADKPDSVDIWVTANSFFTSVSNGKLMEVIDNGNNTKTYKWKVSYPIAQYLISVAMTNYYQYDNYYTALDGTVMTLNHFTYLENWSNTRKTQIDQTPDMMHEFALMFGEYPFLREKYGHAEFNWGGGMEHQTITSIVGFGESLVSHELAHQWFGDMITCKDWHNIWINEGFATYLEALYVEKKRGLNAYKSYIQGDLSTAKGAYGSVYCQDITNVNSIFNGARSYSKGAAVLHMLRGVIGDSLFFKTMYDFANDPLLKYGVAITEDFQRVAETVSGLDLNYFFSEWIYGERYPKYSANWGYSQNGNKYEVNINISQVTTGVTPFFTMPIQLKFNTAAGDTLITVFNNQQAQTFNFVLNNKPTSMVFDPDVWILRDLGNFTSADNQEPTNIFDYKLNQNYPNPFNPETKITYQIGVAGQIKLTIYDILGREVRTLVNEYQNPGEYSYNFNAAGLAGGVYVYELSSKTFKDSKKLVLLQ